MPAEFKAIRVKNRAEFDWLIEHITAEVFRARDSLSCWKAINDCIQEYRREFNLAPNFWEQTRRAHQDSAILRLSRLYDPHSGTNSIGNLLETIRGRVDTASGTPLNLPQLEAEMVSISVADPAVKKLLNLRNDYLAHRNSRHVVKGNFEALPSVSKKEINKLIDRVNGLVRKYRSLFGFPPIINLNDAPKELELLMDRVRKTIQTKQDEFCR